MRRKVLTILMLTVVSAVVVFCGVQDRITARGANQYVALHRGTAERAGGAPTIDEVMVPFIRRSVRDGLRWSGAVMACGLGIAAASGRRAKPAAMTEGEHVRRSSRA